MFLLKKLLFKFMEVGLGLRTYFPLETKDPIFVNFKLSPEEAEKVRRSLPPGFELEKIRFCQSDSVPEYWVSYNLYDIRYPKKELSGVKRARCEINTFVRDPKGRRGVFVFCGSPFVSKEERPSLVGRVCELAERAVIFIYGCGKLIPLTYEVSDRDVRIDFRREGNALSLRHPLGPGEAQERLSDEYTLYNDISYFREGRTYDLVNVNGAFTAARFQAVDGRELESFSMEGPFFSRPPDKVYLHRGEVSYLVNALNRF